MFSDHSKPYQAHLDFEDCAGNLCSKPIKPYQARLNFKNIVKKWFSDPSKPYQVKPQTFTSQFSNLKPYKVQKYQI